MHNRPADPLNAPVLVVGATGKTGRRVADRLAVAGVPVRRASRSGQFTFDWDDERNWPRVLRGARAAYVTVAPDLAAPGAADRAGRFARLAADLDVQRIVLLSGRGEPAARDGERAVQEAGVPWTVIRSSWFAQNFSESFLLDAVRDGAIVLPADGVREPFIDVDDIADLAVAALTAPGHAHKLYEVTGPDLLGFADVAAEISAATGRHVAYHPVALDDYIADGRRMGVPEEMLALYAYLFSETLDGRNAWLADGIREGLGRPPRTFADYARRTARSGVWRAAA